ncbi:MAG: 3-isopropylmalate dehydratase small subunit [Gammaproteobacteria bacterium]|nr:3-isopropylmalate dehydratase small subunit [Gammaproteobacteria bacterium]
MEVKNISGKAIAITGNDIDTDRIIPARYLKALTFSELGEYPFYDERFDADGNPKEHPFNRASAKGAKMLFVNSNFGCGSSREHAPQALKRWGIDAVIGVSYGEIFAGNCEMLGIPAVRAKAEDIEMLQQAAEADPSIEFTVDMDEMVITGGNLRVQLEMPENRRNSLLNGHWDSTGILVQNLNKVKDVYAKLPYTSDYKD